MKKGDKVRCVNNYGNNWLTINKTYDVIAEPGDIDTCICGTVNDGDFITICDDGTQIYCSEEYCEYAEWELIEDDNDENNRMER